MSLGFPLALAGLIALLVPLVIHLLQRGHQASVEISTTQFVPIEQRPEWRWSRLREPWLWLLRSLLLIAAVILLGEPLTKQSAQETQAQGYTLVSTRVDMAPAKALAGDDATVLWLAPGLPPIETSPPPWRAGQLWGQLWRADQTLPATLPLRVIAPALTSEVGAVRPVLGRDVEWIDAPATTAASLPELSLTVVHDNERALDAARINLIAQTWQSAGLAVQVRSTTPADVAPQTQTVLWLSNKSWSDTLDMGIHGLIVTDATQPDLTGRVLQRDARGKPAVIESIDGARTVRRFEYALNADNAAVTAPEFALTLAQTTLSELAQPPSDLPLDAQARQTPTAAADAPDRTRSLDPTWIVIILLLAALERLVAALPARGTAT